MPLSWVGLTSSISKPPFHPFSKPDSGHVESKLNALKRQLPKVAVAAVSEQKRNIDGEDEAFVPEVDEEEEEEEKESTDTAKPVSSSSRNSPYLPIEKLQFTLVSTLRRSISNLNLHKLVNLKQRRTWLSYFDCWILQLWKISLHRRLGKRGLVDKHAWKRIILDLAPLIIKSG